MLINTLFYIAAFHFSPINTALTLSVVLPSAAEVMAILTSTIQFPPARPLPAQKCHVEIVQNEIQTTCSCPYLHSMKANKGIVNNFQWCTWPSNYSSACPQGNVPVLPEAESIRQSMYRIQDKCPHEEPAFCITQCTSGQHGARVHVLHKGTGLMLNLVFLFLCACVFGYNRPSKTCIFNIIHTYICNLTYLGFHLMGPYPCWSSHFHLHASLVIFTWALTLGSVLCSSLGSKHFK